MAAGKVIAIFSHRYRSKTASYLLVQRFVDLSTEDAPRDCWHDWPYLRTKVFYRRMVPEEDMDLVPLADFKSPLAYLDWSGSPLGIEEDIAIVVSTRSVSRQPLAEI
jgi:hypothetical protein